MISANGGIGEQVAHRVLEGRKVLGTIAKLWKENMISREVKQELYERVAIPTLVYYSETQSLSALERRKIEVSEMMFWRNICGIRRVERVTNAIIREWCGCEVSVLERMEGDVLKGFGHVERMGQERVLKKVYQANMEGNRERRRPQRRWRKEV